MDKVEPEKLEWIRDLPAPRKQSTKKVQSSKLRKWREILLNNYSVFLFCINALLHFQAMQARFDFAGTLIPPTEDLPTHLGLHHHGEEPEVSGFS